MKKSILYTLIAGLFFVACNEVTTLEPNLTVEDIEWSYTETETINEFVFENATPEVTTLWDFGNGQTAEGPTATAQYATKGTYTIAMKVLTAGGIVDVIDSIVVLNDNTSFLEGEVYDNLAGGRLNTEGKTWVMDRYYKGHMGIGPDLTSPASWWAAGSDEKAGLGLYDDVFHFVMGDEGLILTQTTNGDVYANGTAAPQLGSTDGHEEPSGSDFIMPFNDAVATWSIGGNNDVISLSGEAFLGYFTGYPAAYNIMTLTEDVLEVACIGADGSAWFQRFVTPENMTAAPIVEPATPVSIASVYELFENGSEMIWALDPADNNATFSTIGVDPVNESNGVGYHTRGSGTGVHFAAITTDLDGPIDFSTGAKVLLDVYVPSSNDYTVDTQESWATLPADEAGFKTVELKLHNTEKSGNAYLTQITLKADLSAYEDQWVTLVFDLNDAYAAATDNEDRDALNRIVFQFGGEGWSYANNVGVYYDNIIGLEGKGSMHTATLKSGSNPVLVIN